MRAKARRGQVFSADALIALALIIMITSIAVNTSGTLQNEISGLLGWYGRANIAQNMLNVLVSTPGEPANWSSNVSEVVVPGLRDGKSTYIEYTKVWRLFEGVESNNSAIINALWKLSNYHNFELEFSLLNASISANVSVSPQIVVPSSSELEICDISQAGTLENTSPIVLYCPNGTFQFSHTGVSYNYYGNQYGICILSGAFVGNNFNVYSGENFTVNGSLSVGSDGSLKTKNVFINGNVSIANTGELTASGVAYVNGSILIYGSGNVADVGTLYVYGGAYIGNSGFLTSNGSVYIVKDSQIGSNGVAKIGGSLYEYSNMTISNSGIVTVRGATYIGGGLEETGNGNLLSNGYIYIRGDTVVSSSKIHSNSSTFINGNAYIGNGGIINSTGNIYINGSVYVNGTLEGKNIYINGNLIIGGYTGRVLALGNIVVNGNVIVMGSSGEYPLSSGNSTVIGGDLIVKSGYGINVKGSLYIGGNLTTVGYPNTPISVGENLITDQYINLTTSGTPLTIGRNAYIGYQVYSNSTISIKAGSLFVYYTQGYYDRAGRRRYYYGVIMGPNDETLHITGGYLYFYDGTWYSLDGYFYSDTDYSMNGYGLLFRAWYFSRVDVTNAGTWWYIYLRDFSTRRYYEAPIKLVSYSSYSVSGDIEINPNGSILEEPNSTLPSFPAYSNVSSAISSAVVYPRPMPSFEMPVCSIIQKTQEVTVNSAEVNVTYSYPSIYNLSRSHFKIVVINGSIFEPSSLEVNKSISSSRWIEQDSIPVIVQTSVYAEDYNMSPSLKMPYLLYGGQVEFAPIGYLEITVPEGATGNLTLISTYTSGTSAGFSVLVVLSKKGTTAYGFLSSDGGTCNVKISGNNVLIPWTCLIPYNGLGGNMNFMIWAYSLKGYNWVDIRDIANMNAYLLPSYGYALLRVLVWGG